MSIEQQLKTLKKYLNKDQVITSDDEQNIGKTVSALLNIKNTKQLERIVGVFPMDKDSIKTCVLALQQHITGGDI